MCLPSTIQKTSSYASTKNNLFTNVLNESAHITNNYAGNGLNDCHDEKGYISKIEDWKSKKYVRETRRNIPNGILPTGYTGHLSDYKVVSRGSDDEVFKKNKDLLRFMTRGLTVMDIGKYSNDCRKDIVISANRKFFECEVGPQGIDLTGQNYSKHFLKSSTEVFSIVSTEKMNGEAAHFSGRFIEGEFYLIAGSKNVHLLFQNEEHIEKYTDTCFVLAKVIARTVLQKWNQLNDNHREFMSYFLDEQRFTVVCEILLPSQQHVVSLENQTNIELCVLALTEAPFRNTKSLLAKPTNETLKMFSDLGFRVPYHETLHLNELNSHVKKIRDAKNTEGVVYYFQDANKNTLGLLKLKSIWYILRRALREQACNRRMDSNNLNGISPLDYKKDRARKRLVDIQKWLYTTDEQVKMWQALSDKWMEFVEKEIEQNRLAPDSIRFSFPTIWNSLLSNEKVN